MKTTHYILCIFSFSLLILIGGNAHAFSQMVRHGYVNCTSCHVSPAGGGALTAYGRELSGAGLSTSSFDGEGGFAYSALKLPEWLSVGGDVRSVSIYRNTPQASSKRFLFMQADVEVAATLKKWTIDINGGVYVSQPQSRRHYVLYKYNDHLSFRAGKFQQAFGLMLADHISTVKRALGWDEGTETYNIEAAWLNDNWNLYATVNLGRPDNLDKFPEKGGGFRGGISLSESSQLGLSYYFGKNSEDQRHVAGPFAIVGLGDHFFILSELDFQAQSRAQASTQLGFFTTHRLDYEPIQGLHFYGLIEGTRSDLSNASTRYFSYALGSQFFPRPHFEFDLLWRRQFSAAYPGAQSDYATLLMHLYL